MGSDHLFLQCVKCGSEASYIVVVGIYGLTFGGSMCSDCFDKYMKDQMEVLEKMKRDLNVKEGK